MGTLAEPSGWNRADEHMRKGRFSWVLFVLLLSEMHCRGWAEMRKYERKAGEY